MIKYSLLIFFLISYWIIYSHYRSLDDSYIYATTSNRLSKIRNILIKSNYRGNEENVSFIDIIKKNSSDELLLTDARGNKFMINTAESIIFTEIMIRGNKIIMKDTYIEIDMKKDRDYQKRLFESGKLKRKSQ